MEYEIEYKIDTFPSSEKFQIFKTINEFIYQIISPKAYNIDTGEIEYINMVYDDPITAEIITDYLNEAENDVK